VPLSSWDDAKLSQTFLEVRVPAKLAEYASHFASRQVVWYPFDGSEDIASEFAVRTHGCPFSHFRNRHSGAHHFDDPIHDGLAGHEEGSDGELLPGDCCLGWIRVGLCARAPCASAGEVITFRVCLISLMIYPLLMAMASEVWHCLVLTVMFSGAIIINFPIMTALKANLVAQNEQGVVQGFLAAVKVLSLVLGDLFFGWLFRFSTDGGKGDQGTALIPFAGISVMAMLACLISFTLPARMPPPPASDGTLEAPNEISAQDLELRGIDTE